MQVLMNTLKIPSLPLIPSSKRFCVFSDQISYYLASVNCLQERCEICSLAEDQVACFSFCDYGVPDIFEIGIVMHIITENAEYISECLRYRMYYKSDNAFSIWITGIPKISEPISKSYLSFNWISYTSDFTAEGDMKRNNINDSFSIMICSAFIERIRKTDKLRESDASFYDAKLLCGKWNCWNNTIKTAWKQYDELCDDMSPIINLLEIIESDWPFVNHSVSKHSSSAQFISVPINCYFDKGFYSILNCISDCAVEKICFSSGGSAIQFVIKVRSSDIDLLAYLYYCTIDDRNHHLYLTEEQKLLEKYLSNNHPIYMVKKAIDCLTEKYHNATIVSEADIIYSAKAYCDAYFELLNEKRNKTYASMKSKGHVQITWVHEYQFYILVKGNTA